MYPITRIPMNIVAALMSTFLCIQLFGCTVGQIGDAANTEVEITSPTGCLKSQARYFDPATKKCREATDRHDSLVLNAYRYVNELAQENAGENEYAIFPKKYMTIDETEALWSDLREHGAKMVVLGGDFPGDRTYDPVLEWDQKALDEDLKWQKDHNNLPKVWGVGAGEGCGWDTSDAPADTIEGMLEEGLNTIEKERPRPEMRKALVDDHDCRISFIDVLADAKVMRDWWNRHLNEVEGIQAMVNFVDKNMPSMGPMNPLKEGE